MGKCFHDNAPCFNSWSRQNRVATRNLSVITDAKSLLILLAADHSDAGLALVAQLDRHYRITKRFGKCFEDHRDPKRKCSNTL